MQSVQTGNLFKYVRNVLTHDSEDRQMAMVPRMKHEGWPGWAKMFFILGSLALIVCGILVVISSTHGQAVLGIISIVVGAVFLFFWLANPRWRDDPAITS